MTGQLTYDSTAEEHRTRARTIARRDAIQFLRRAAAALESTLPGEGNEDKIVVTVDVRHQLPSILRDLECLS